MKTWLVALVMLIPALAWAESQVADPKPEQLKVEQPWVRLVPPVSPNTAAYLMLHNNGEGDRVLVGVSSDAADAVEMHTVVEQDGATSMQRLHEVKVPAGDCVTFEPGGNHIMFIGLKQPLAEGEKVQLTLQFKNGDQVPVSLTVKRSQQAANPGGDGHHHHHH